MTRTSTQASRPTRIRPKTTTVAVRIIGFLPWLRETGNPTLAGRRRRGKAGRRTVDSLQACPDRGRRVTSIFFAVGRWQPDAITALHQTPPQIPTLVKTPRRMPTLTLQKRELVVVYLSRAR